MVGARQEMLRKALVLMEDALALLDEADCSADVGAHLDLALWRLKEIVPITSASEESGTLADSVRAAK
jgi:hypothetical protein